ncbi:MAG: septum formation initiator family protein [Alphaproteobacteria bacterium]|nr:septum formation initiator family protein [Alphaproteobacteria bacterium]
MLTICFGLTGYFAYHTVSGRYGLEARAVLLDRATALDFEAGALHKAASRLQNEIALLSPDRPDSDLVEEIARELLGYADPGDRLIRVR